MYQMSIEEYNEQGMYAGTMRTIQNGDDGKN